MSDYPDYALNDEVRAPSELGVRREGSPGAIADSLAAINYYVDGIAFGESTGIAKMRGFKQSPLGIRFFAKTGLQCSNGAPMHEYVDAVPKGTALGEGAQKLLQKYKLPGMRGYVPGILEDTKASLDPMTFLNVATSTGFAACKRTRLPVGDADGNLQSVMESRAPWIDPATTQRQGRGKPTQERWVFDRWISQEEWDATPKTEAPPQAPGKYSGNYDKDGNARLECFQGQQGQQQQQQQHDLNSKQWIAGILLGILAIGVTATYSRRK